MYKLTFAGKKYYINSFFGGILFVFWIILGLILSIVTLSFIWYPIIYLFAQQKYLRTGQTQFKYLFMNIEFPELSARG